MSGNFSLNLNPDTVDFTMNYLGREVVVIAEVLYIPPTTKDIFQASCPTDLSGELEVLYLKVMDWEGKEIKDVVVPDSVIIRELEIQREMGDLI